ncbi:MAG: S8 family serine peptidase [Dehalococcoidia bacterium]
MKRLLFLAITLVASVLIAVFAVGVQADEDNQRPEELSIEEEAIRFASDKTGSPVEQFSTKNIHSIVDSVDKKIRKLVTVMDTESDTIYHLVESLDGNLIDYQTYREEVASRYHQKYGKLSPKLYENLQGKTTPEVTIGLWLHCDDRTPAKEVAQKYPEAKLNDLAPSKNTDMDLYSRIQEEIKQVRKDVYANAALPVIDFIKSNGGVIIDKSYSAPLIFATVPKELVQELENRDDVDTIYSVSDKVRPLMEDSVPAINVASEWDDGYTGGDVRIAVVEPRGEGASTEYGGIDFSHEDIVRGDIDDAWYGPGIGNYYYYGSYLAENGWIKGDHATSVASVIGSIDKWEDDAHLLQGVAKGGLPLLSANANGGDEAAMIPASEWAVGLGPCKRWNEASQQWTEGAWLDGANTASVLNCSFGLDNGGDSRLMDRFYDHLVHAHRKTVVTAAGNVDDDADQLVDSPALAYNVITVGSYNDKDNYWWDGDEFYDGSIYQETGNREKPEVVAPGVNITTLRNGSGDLWRTPQTGTSFAAPHVSGVAALLMQRFENTGLEHLKEWPELIKAVIMASALNNLGVDSPAMPHEKFGAGGVSAEHAGKIVSEETYVYNNYNEADFPGGSKDFQFSANNGDRCRVAMCWSSHTTYSETGPPYYTDELLTDFDIMVFSPSGELVEDSTLIDNAYELVDFQANETGTYTIKVSYKYFDADTEYCGIAWYAAPPLERTLAVSPSQRSLGRVTADPLRGAYHNDEVVTVNADPSYGWIFEQWEYPDGNLADCVVDPYSASTTAVMDADYELVAKFTRQELTNPLDIILNIDRSGSMGTQKMEDAKNAATLFVDYLADQDKVGLVSFSSSATLDSPLTSDFDDAKSIIAGYSSGGSTNMGDALLKAINEIEANGQQDRIPSIIYLTDGVNNTGYTNQEILNDLVPQAVEAGIIIYTLGFGNDVNGSFLQNVAEATGGKYYHAPNAETLKKIYIELAHQAKGLAKAAEYTGTVAEGETKVETFMLNSVKNIVKFLLLWPGSDLDLQVIAPDGTTMYPGEGIIYSGNTHPEYLILENPEPGEWTIKVEGKEVTGTSEEYTIMVFESVPMMQLKPTTWQAHAPASVSNETFTVSEIGGLESLEAVTFTASDLTDETGNLIPSDSFSFNPNGFSIAAGGSLTVEGTLSVPSGVTLSDYTGTIEVSGSGQTADIHVSYGVPPAAVDDLSVTANDMASATLTWTAPGDDGDVGTASQYDIRYSETKPTPGEEDAWWENATRCQGEPAPQVAGSTETYTLGITPGTYYFAMKTVDDTSSWSEISNIEVWWGHLLVDEERGTKLGIDSTNEEFKFFTPDEELQVKQADRMKVYTGEDIADMFTWMADIEAWIIDTAQLNLDPVLESELEDIEFEELPLKLILMTHSDEDITISAVATGPFIDFCFAVATVSGGILPKTYLLHDRIGTIPMADFTTINTSGTEPLLILFTDLSVGDIANWQWDFGDGETSSKKNPSHWYNDPGTYTVSLTVSGPLGTDTETKTDYITVEESNWPW